MGTGLEIGVLALAGTAAASTVYGIHQSRKAAKKQEKEIDRQRLAAEKVKKDLAAAETEKRRRVHARGRQLPQTVLTGSFSGVSPANIQKQKLLGV